MTVACPECGGPIELPATQCSSCGFPVPNSREATGKALRTVGKAVGIGLGVVLAVLVLYSMFASPSSRSAPSGNSATVRSRPAEALVQEWNWYKEPDSGTSGAVRWVISVRNVSRGYLRSVKVEMTTYDRLDRIVAAEFTYVDAIPPGETRSTTTYTDLYGTEVRAAVMATEAHSSN